MLRPYLQLCLLCTVSLLAVQNASAQTYSSHPEPLQPRIEAGAKVGTDRSMGTMEGWAPILQDDASVLYTDIRWMADDNSDQEGNLGLGYRQIVNDKVAGGKAIVGTHGWIDRRRTDRGSNFYQLTGGVEYLKEDWDVKANAYVPLNSEKTYTTANIGQANPYLAGTGIFVDTNGQVIEEAQPGGDIEIGYRIPAFEQNVDAIRVYGGGYGFKGDRTDDTIGARIRTSVDINPLLNVGARFQYDEPRGSQGFIEATLRFPFTAKKRFQQDKLRARMDESPERDIDIVTNTAVDTGLRKEVINTTSNQTQRVLHVDNTAASGGDGSVENPFNTLAAGQAVMLDNDTLFVHEGDGTTTGQDQGIVIDSSNVQLIGSGTDFVFDTDRFTTRKPGITPSDGTVIAAATAAPVITNTAGIGIDVTGADPMITGVTVQNANGNGIQITADNGQVFDSATVNDVTTNNNNGRGILVQALNGSTITNVAITDSTANGNIGGLSRGIEIRSDGVGSNIENAFVTGSTALTNAQTGLYVVATLSGHIGTATVSDNTVNSNLNRGIYISSANGGMIDTANITNNTANANTQDGIWALIQAASSINTLLIDGNMTNGNTGTSGNGIYLQSAGTVTMARIANNTVGGNARSGVIASSAAGQVAAITMENNALNNNSLHGLFISTTGTGTFSDMTLENNVTSNNGTNGLYAYTNGGFIDNLLINNHTANSNIQRGIVLQSASSGQLTNVNLQNSVVTNNSYDGLYVRTLDTSVLSANISGTTITGNGTVASTSYWGIRIDHDSTNTLNVDFGSVSGSTGGNRIFNNIYRDVNVDSRPGTVAATFGTIISAQNNWWGVNTGLDQATRATFDNGSAGVNGSRIDASNHLTTDPGI